MSQAGTHAQARSPCRIVSLRDPDGQPEAAPKTQGETMSANPAPGFKKYPKHRVAARPAGVRVQVRLNGEVIADSRGAVALDETPEGHVVAPVVYYLPRKDVKMDRLVRSNHETHCPFKGQAS